MISIQMMDIASIDLNLLVVFDALMDCRSVTVAGQRLSLSQPAMSYALSKLRKHFGDPLFVRVRNQMLPTPRATTLAKPVRSVLDQIKKDILHDRSFAPSATRKTFTLCMSDIGEMVFLPPLTRALLQQAPHASLNVVYLDPRKLTETMESGEVDLAIGYFPDLQNAGIFQQKLSTSDFVCVARKNNPHTRGRLTMARFLEAPHVSVRAAGRSQDLFERHLSKAGIKRSVAATVPHFLSLIELIPQTNLLAAVPRVLGDMLAKISDVRIHPLPMPSPHFPVKQFWHRRYHTDAANQWIRSVIRDLFQQK